MARKKKVEEAVPQEQSPKNSWGNRLGKVQPAKQPTKKREKPAINYDREEQKLMEKLAAYHTIMQKAKAKKGEAAVKSLLANKLREAWLEKGSQTDNPQFMSDLAKFNFAAADNTGRDIKIPLNEDGSIKPFKDWLVEQNVPAKLIPLLSSLVNEEEYYNIVSPEILEKSNPALAEKIRGILGDNLTDEEFQQVVTRVNRATFKDGYIDNVTKIVKENVKNENDQKKILEHVLNMTSAVTFKISHVTFMGDLSPFVNNLMTVEDDDDTGKESPDADD